MKKFLIVFFCILGFGVIVTLSYFFSYNFNPVDLSGRYFLTQIIQTDTTDEDNPVETTTDVEGENYIELYKDNTLICSMNGYLNLEDGLKYIYSSSGTGFELKKDKKVILEGYYAEGEIIIIVDDTEDNNMFYEYYFKIRK